MVVRRVHPNDEIEGWLFISESTVEKHVSSIHDKIDVNTVAQAVVWRLTIALAEHEEDEGVAVWALLSPGCQAMGCSICNELVC